MFWKILLLIAIIVGVLYGFKMISRPTEGGAARAGRESKPRGRSTSSDGQAVDLVKCEHCGAFTTPGSPCNNCGK